MIRFFREFAEEFIEGDAVDRFMLLTLLLFMIFIVFVILVFAKLLFSSWEVL